MIKTVVKNQALKPLKKAHAYEQKEIKTRQVEMEKAAFSPSEQARFQVYRPKLINNYEMFILKNLLNKSKTLSTKYDPSLTVWWKKEMGLEKLRLIKQKNSFKIYFNRDKN